MEHKFEVGQKVRYKECDESLPDRGIGVVVRVRDWYVIVDWEYCSNACDPKNLILV